MDAVSVAEEKTTEAPTSPRERGSCAGCGCKDRALMAPKKGMSKGYAGPMFCMGCNPRFVSGGPVEAFFARL